MRCLVNDAPHDLPDNATVADLLASLGLPSARCAVEVNRVLIRRIHHAEHRLAEGDRIEVVTLVGGG
jgi:sulfur carrier protein